MQEVGSTSVDTREATDPRSWRGRLPYQQALRVAMQAMTLGTHRTALAAAALVGSSNFNFAAPIARSAEEL